VLELTEWIEDGFEVVAWWWCLVMEGRQGLPTYLKAGWYINSFRL
jgi:hypothetical protein